jgi:KDO2-lipid IV(A) lauroyltransferase
VAERGRWSPRTLIEYGAVRSLLALFACLPSGVAYGVGAEIGRWVYRLDRRHRAVVVENLRQAFPGRYSEAEIALLGRMVFENLGHTAVDTARIHRLARLLTSEALTLEGVERIRDAKTRGNGVLFLTAHFGPWELFPPLFAARLEPGNLVVRPLDNPWLDGFFERRRSRGGNRVISKQGAGRTILKALRANELVGILIDQHIREEDGVIVPFFGRPASTAVAPALIALRSDATVLPMSVTRRGLERYHFTVWPEVPVRRSGDLRRDLVLNTAAFNVAIERMIREHPEQWFWVHRRWKTPHPLDPRLSEADPEGS